jgi:GDP-4-dehydro-6-deoxy-D-mannose reductase
MKVLITGISGFAASHLVDYIKANNLADEIHGTIRSYNTNLDNIKDHVKDLHLHEMDLCDAYSVDRVFKEVKPDKVFHLAAQAFVPKSWKSPMETVNSNVNGSVNVFEAIRRNADHATVHIAGSSEEYGLVLPEETPIDENQPLRPLSPYGASKASMDLFAYQYFKSYGLKILRTRTFNHTGPRRGSVYVASTWCKQVADAEAGKREAVIYHGNLEAKRDFTDVRDIVRAYWIATEKCTPGEVYNICSGNDAVFSMQEVQDLIVSKAKIPFERKLDESRMRPSDLPLLSGNSNKFRKETGWKPEITFDQTIEDLLNYWRERA